MGQIFEWVNLGAMTVAQKIEARSSGMVARRGGGWQES